MTRIDERPPATKMLQTNDKGNLTTTRIVQGPHAMLNLPQFVGNASIGLLLTQLKVKWFALKRNFPNLKTYPGHDCVG